MKAITIWQPWATLIALEVKPWEFRGWPPPKSLHGVRIAVHAGRRPARRSEIEALASHLTGPEPWTVGLLPSALPVLEQILSGIVELPTGHVLCTARLGNPVSDQSVAEALGAPVGPPSAAGRANWAWPLNEVRRLERPEPAIGKQGFWVWAGAKAPA